MFHGVVINPSKTEDERQANIKKASRLMDDEKNPCLKEHKLSFKCLDENNFNRDTCTGYFENYKRCKEFWNNIRVERRRAGIVPNLPPADEREQIKKDYFEKKRAMQQMQQQ